MPADHLREVLEELHEELERAESLDEATRELLRGARTDIETALHEDASDPSGKASSARTAIGRALERFETEHPEGVATLQRVLHALSELGI